MCQDVCPHNRKIEETNLEEFRNDLKYRIELEELEEISNKEFMRRYRDRAFSWRGRPVILRNLQILKD